MENTTNTTEEPGYTSPVMKRIMDSVRADLHNIFWKLEIPIQPTEYSTPLKDMGVDSLEIVELCLTIETHFKITVTDKELSLMATFNDAVELVTKKLIAQWK